MKQYWISLYALAALTVISCGGAEDASGPYQYSPAFVNERHELWVFPFDREAYSVTLPVGLSYVVYGEDAKSLYGSGNRLEENWPGLLRIEFKPVRVTTEPGTAGLGIVSAAVPLSQNKIVVSGEYKGACGIFEVKRPSGQIREVSRNSTCDYAESWVRISLSPDGKRVVGYRKPRLELIDLTQGSVRSLGEDLIAGAWSPDGEWLAVLESGGQNHTILLDAKDLVRKRVLGQTNLQWSPDSHYLLGERTGFCGVYFATFVAIDVDTGKERTVSSSRCKVNLNTSGWIDSAIKP